MGKLLSRLFLLISISFLFSCNNEKVALETTGFKLALDYKGFISSLFDKEKSIEYYPKGVRSPLLSLFKDSTYFKPVAFEFNTSASKIYLDYSNGSKAEIGIKENKDYLRFELLSLEPRNDIQAIVWGPYPTTIDEKIGETVCVVRNKDFAIGLQALEINTIEGLPDDGDDAGGGFFIEPLPGQTLPDSLKNQVGNEVHVNVNVQGDMPEYVRLYRGSAAVKTKFGSELRLFSRDRREHRVIGQGDNIQQVEPVNVDFIGSTIALFGCPVPEVLDVIESIELGEGLPHPMIDGQWIKKLDWIGDPYLLNEGDPHKSVEYAKALGFKLIHIGDIFKTWGHFGLETNRFPGGADEIKQLTTDMREKGISLGVHTLTMFTGTNDPYVSPVPSDSLCKTGSSILAREVDQDDKEIYIEDPAFFRNLGHTHTAKVGKELINYRAVSDKEPWRLLDCERGQFGTFVSAHHKGQKIDKLVNNDYRGFYPDIHLQDEYAKRLAEVCNETGIDLMDFDGYGGGSPTGHGAYGAARFIDRWYKNLDRYRLTCGASTFHYYWHIYAFMNWGEPWYDALRESQVNYRLENQRYFERNYMPAMLGWFTLNPEFRPEEVEWIQARSAAFDAGYLLRVDESIEKSGYKDELFSLIREWQKAIKSDAFSDELKEAFKNPKNEYHLEKARDRGWRLIPLKLYGGFQHKYRQVQTGEPVANHFTINNPYDSQALKFYITVQEGGVSAHQSNVILTINDYQSITLNETIKAGDRIICDGEAVYLCDTWWNKKKLLTDEKIPTFEKGQNTVSIKSSFSGPDAPQLEFEFKTLGEPRKIP